MSRYRRFSRHLGAPLGEGDNKPLVIAAAIGILAWLLWPKKAKADASVPSSTGVVGTREWTVSAGEALSSIAAKAYGDGTIGGADQGWKWWPLIWEANKSVVGCNWNRLKVGMKLLIPTKSSLPMDRQAEIFARAPNWQNPPTSC